MKKILNTLSAISLITCGSSNLITCVNNKLNTLLTSEELTKLKEENSKIINGNKLEWISPQEKPFNKVDNKYYFVVWHIKNNDDWKIIKFKNDIDIGYYKKRILDKYNTYDLKMTEENLLADENRFAHHFWWDVDDGSHFKAVYRWNLDIDIPDLDVNNKTGEIKIK